MKNAIACSVILVSSLAAENLFNNGSMNTAGGWKGGGKIIKDEPVKGAVVEEGG